jgi:uncharacterized phage-associated protein
MAQQQQSKTKGNPAHKRMSNANLKARRARSWAKREAEKKSNKLSQLASEALNRVLREKGHLTAWEISKAARANRRAH